MGQEVGLLLWVVEMVVKVVRSVLMRKKVRWKGKEGLSMQTEGKKLSLGA